MNKILSLALCVAGIVLVIYGLQASDSIGSGLSRTFTGTPSDRTLWLLIGGGVLILVGLGGLIVGRKP